MGMKEERPAKYPQGEGFPNEFAAFLTTFPVPSGSGRGETVSIEMKHTLLSYEEYAPARWPGKYPEWVLSNPGLPDL